MIFKWLLMDSRALHDEYLPLPLAKYRFDFLDDYKTSNLYPSRIRVLLDSFRPLESVKSLYSYMRIEDIFLLKSTSHSALLVNAFQSANLS